MRIRGYDITEKRVAAVCAVILLVVSLFAAIKQANAATNPANLSSGKEQQKTSKSAGQTLNSKPDDARQPAPYQSNNNDASKAKNETSAVNKADTNEAKKAANGSVQSAKKDDSKNKDKAADKKAQPSADMSKKSSDYTYTVQDGDSYSVVVRRAISEHGGSNLTAAQKIAAETKLVEQAGWPEVDAGQTVKIDNTALSQAISSARAMTADEQQSWQAYADAVVW